MKTAEAKQLVAEAQQEMTKQLQLAEGLLGNADDLHNTGPTSLDPHVAREQVSVRSADVQALAQRSIAHTLLGMAAGLAGLVGAMGGDDEE